MGFAKILGFVTPAILKFFEITARKLTQNKEEEKEYAFISWGVIAVCWCYSFANIHCTDGAFFSALLWIQEHWWILAAYILIMAWLPSVVAQKEREKGTFWADENYALRNRRFNLIGVGAACAVFGLADGVIIDFGALKYFYVDDLIPSIASVSVWIAIIYQQIERKNYKAKELDHDPALKHLNQKLNLLHLFHVYLLVIVSVVYLVSYTRYCWTYHIEIVIRPVYYYILITVALIFFYALSQHEHRYLYLTSIICIPIILISSVYWMTWFTFSREMRFWQWVFVFIHSMLYMFFIFKKEKIICVRRYEDNADSAHTGIRIGKREIIFENYFPLVLPVIVGIIYIIIWKLPSFIYRLPASEAYNYIDMICADTDINADEVIKQSEEQDMFNKEDGTYDIEAFMRFLSRDLGEQLVEKGIINEEGDVPSREVLNKRYVNKPRQTEAEIK